MSFFQFSPSPSLKSKQITSQDDLGTVIGITGTQIQSNRLPTVRDENSASNGFGSLTKKKTSPSGVNLEHQQSVEMDPSSFISSIITDSGNSESSEPPTSLADSLSGGSNQIQIIPTQQQQTAVEMGHSRNSSNTSQVSEHFFK